MTVVLAAACEAEWSLFRHRLGGGEGRLPMGEIVPARPGLALLRLGVGEEHARRSSEALSRARPDVVLHVGFAGGLRTGVTAGGLLLVTAVSRSMHRVGESALPAPDGLDPGAVDALRAKLALLPDRLAQGPLLTVDRFVDRAEDKGLLGRSGPYIACEMEAALVRDAVESAGGLYLGVRAISDAEHESVPPMSIRGALRRRKLGRLLRWAGSSRAPLEAFNFVQGARRARRTLSRAVPVALDVAARLTADGG